MLQNAINSARVKAKSALTQLYDDVCTIYINEPVLEEELAMVRNYMSGDLCRSYESAFALADAWIFLQTSALPPTFFDETLRTIKAITAEDIQRLAQEYLCKENLKEVVSGKKMG